ncbi:MAG: low molecular weight protein-tyrosine-phosphatase [Thermohalobaculum sp.]|nr:low molecular weight protein-tyrosine-phosphatase [Thermohalobaculum sp.]
MTRILCVCLGNTCRSPMAQGVIEAMAQAAGLAVEVDSAGLGAWHVGKPPHPMGLAAASARGYDTSHQRTRMVAPGDFHAFDLIVAMDGANLAALHALRPAGARARIRLFDPQARDIPDPWGGTPADYDHALDLIEAAARALVAGLAARR